MQLMFEGAIIRLTTLASVAGDHKGLLFIKNPKQCHVDGHPLSKAINEPSRRRLGGDLATKTLIAE